MSSASSTFRPEASKADRTRDANDAFRASVQAVGTNTDQELQSRAKNIHAMDEAITKQEKELHQGIKNLAKKNDEMQKFLDKSNKQLSTFESLGPTHDDLDADLEDLEELLNMIEDRERLSDAH